MAVSLLTGGLGFGGALVTRGLASTSSPTPPTPPVTGLAGGIATVPVLNGEVPWPSPPWAGSWTGLRRAVMAALKTDADVSAMAGARVFPGIVSEGQQLPSVAVTLAGVDRQHSLDGPTGSVLARVTVAAVSKMLVDSQDLALAVRVLFDGFTGNLYGVNVWETVLDDEEDTYTLPPDGTGRPVYVTPVSMTFHHKEPTAS